MTFTADLEPHMRLLCRSFVRLNWELHVAQTGLVAFAVKRPWRGLPVVIAAIAMLWIAYWACAVPLATTLCLVATVRMIPGRADTRT